MSERRFAGKSAVISGGSRGLGNAAARRFAAEGAHVAICGRDTKVLEEAQADLLTARVSAQQVVFAHAADVSRSEDVEGFVTSVVERLRTIDVLVCNAAVQGPIGPFPECDWNEWKQTIETNLFGSALLCRAIIPGMKERGAGKIIMLSGGGATQARPNFSAYAASKTAVVRLVETLAAELAGSGIDVNAIAPGALNTRMLDGLLAAGPERAGEAAYAGAVKQRDEGGAPFEHALDLIAFLASSQSDGISGRLIAALWDDWQGLPEQRERLAGSDVYTLRRIVPKDRGWPKPR